MVQGEAQEEKLIAAAKGVAASTAQLLLACQVKADTNSESNKRLQVMCVEVVRGWLIGWCDLTEYLWKMYKSKYVAIVLFIYFLTELVQLQMWYLQIALS